MYDNTSWDLFLYSLANDKDNTHSEKEGEQRYKVQPKSFFRDITRQHLPYKL